MAKRNSFFLLFVQKSSSIAGQGSKIYTPAWKVSSGWHFGEQRKHDANSKEA
jgi:hypothetical protein